MISEYYDRDRPTFYMSIQSVRDNGMDMTGWLDYFATGLETQMIEVRERSEQAIRRDVLVKQYGLNARQGKALDYLLQHGELSIQDFEALCPIVNRRSLQRDDGEARSGSARWRRITEERAGAKSVFHFDVPGSVAKSTHAGLPWLRYLRNQLGGRVHFWPFDGWEIPSGKSALVEVYPSLWSKSTPREGRTPDQHDAYVAAARSTRPPGSILNRC
jgi:hypothetical protein